jgi:glycerol-3-phosphate acyltransferase PlsX
MEDQGLTPDQKTLVTGVLDEVREGFDPEEQGGAPLLGVNGNVIVGHGRSSADAIAQMIRSARTLATENVAQALEEAFRSHAA